MTGLVPEYSFDEVFVAPWRDLVWVVVLGILVTLSNGLVGCYLVLRKMSLVGDAISHSVLPGIVVAFLLAQVMGGWTIFVGALVAGLVTAFLIEFLHEKSRLKGDAATGIVFTALFAFGVVLVSLYSGNAHIDTDCVLFGDLIAVNEELPVRFAGVDIAPPLVLRVGLVLCVVVGLIAVFYKELLVTSFDPALATSLGISARAVHYGLMAILSLVVVVSFEAVGSILAVAMLVLPGATAYLLTERLSRMLWISAVVSVLGGVLGFHLAIFLNTSFAGAMVVATSVLFGVAWGYSVLRAAVGRSVVLTANDPGHPGLPGPAS